MHLTLLPLIGLVALALAAPAPTSPNKDVADQDHVLYLITNSDDNKSNNAAVSVRQEDRCDWESYCLPEYHKCVKSCNSLKNSDW
jgi:hypothetical protein